MIAGEANLVPPTVSVSAAMNNRPIRLTTDANVSTAEPASLDLQDEHSDELLGAALAKIYRRILAFGDPAVEQRSIPAGEADLSISKREAQGQVLGSENGGASSVAAADSPSGP
jgi:hypothetical protein